MITTLLKPAYAVIWKSIDIRQLNSMKLL